MNKTEPRPTFDEIVASTRAAREQDQAPRESWATTLIRQLEAQKAEVRAAYLRGRADERKGIIHMITRLDVEPGMSEPVRVLLERIAKR